MASELAAQAAFNARRLQACCEDVRRRRAGAHPEQTWRNLMVRKTLIALAAAATLGAAALTPGTAAAAHGFHRGGHAGHHGHFAPRHAFHNGFAFRHRPVFVRHHVRRHFAFVGVPLVASDSCVVVRRVWTRWGWHWRRIWVC
jgi:hypothetical protein